MPTERTFQRNLSAAINGALSGALDWDLLRGIEQQLRARLSNLKLEVIDNDGHFQCDTVDEAIGELQARRTQPWSVRIDARRHRDLHATVFILLDRNGLVIANETQFYIGGSDETSVLGTAQVFEDALKRGTIRAAPWVSHADKPEREEYRPSANAAAPTPDPKPWYRRLAHSQWTIAIGATVIGGVIAGVILAVILGA